MRYPAILLALLTLASTAKAQYQGKPDRCLVVSADGNRFDFRDAADYKTSKRKFKESDLTKIAKSGVIVIRLETNASDGLVQVRLAKCVQTAANPVIVVPGPPCCYQCGPRFRLIAAYIKEQPKIFLDGEAVREILPIARQHAAVAGIIHGEPT